MRSLFTCTGSVLIVDLSHFKLDHVVHLLLIKDIHRVLDDEQLLSQMELCLATEHVVAEQLDELNGVENTRNEAIGKHFSQV